MPRQFLKIADGQKGHHFRRHSDSTRHFAWVQRAMPPALDNAPWPERRTGGDQGLEAKSRKCVGDFHLFLGDGMTRQTSVLQARVTLLTNASPSACRSDNRTGCHKCRQAPAKFNFIRRAQAMCRGDRRHRCRSQDRARVDSSRDPPTSIRRHLRSRSPRETLQTTPCGTHRLRRWSP